MIKYCFILDEETGLVQLGVGCPDEYYIEIGMEQRDVEQSEIDQEWYLIEKCPHYTEEEKFNMTVEAKYKENNTKANTARYSQEFTLTIQDKECVFDTNQTTQADLLTAFAVCSTGATYDGWVTNNGIVLDLTMEDIVLISAVFKEKSNVYGKWNTYKTMIDNATTLEEVEAIVIDYTQDIEPPVEETEEEIKEEEE